MRILATSDIHIDKNGDETLEALVEFARKSAPDVLVLAGDVATSPTIFLQTLLALRPTAGRMVFVAGNHDVWSHPELVARGQHAWWRLDTLLPALCAEAGVDDLDAGPVEIDGVAFCGTLGWYDLSTRDDALGAPPEAYRRGEFAGLRWMDHVYAVFPSDDGRPLQAPAIAERLRARLDAQLRAVRAPRVVGITHMLPFEAQLHKKDLAGWRFAQAFIGHLGLGERLLADPRVVLSLAGHTHHGSDLQIGSLRALAAPLGYRREWNGQSPAEAVARTARLIEL